VSETFFDYALDEIFNILIDWLSFLAEQVRLFFSRVLRSELAISTGPFSALVSRGFCEGWK